MSRPYYVYDGRKDRAERPKYEAVEYEDVTISVSEPATALQTYLFALEWLKLTGRELPSEATQVRDRSVREGGPSVSQT